MEYVIIDIATARAHGIEILPTQRQSNDKTQTVIHANKVACVDVFNQLKRYQYDDPEFIELLNSPEWTPEEGAEVPDENLGRIMAVQLLNDEVTKDINTYEFSDEESLEVKNFYPDWYEGVEIKNKEKWNHNGLLWQCLKKHTSSTDNEPSVDHADYWRVIDNDHAGTLEDPIPYTPPMRLENKMYYTENGVTYLAIRNSGQSVTDKLSNLVGKYVEVVK